MDRAVNLGTNMVVIQHLVRIELRPKSEPGLEAVQVKPLVDPGSLHYAADPLLE